MLPAQKREFYAVIRPLFCGGTDSRILFTCIPSQRSHILEGSFSQHLAKSPFRHPWDYSISISLITVIAHAQISKDPARLA